MNSIKSRFLNAVLLCLLICAFVALGAYTQMNRNLNDLENLLSTEKEVDTIRLWYYRSELSVYLTDAAAEYFEQTGIKVIPTLKDGTYFLENAYESSVRSKNADDMPDLLITGSESLETAVLSGLAFPIADENFVRNASRFSVRAQDNVSYNSRIMAYPLCFETPVFIYNSTYLTDIAKASIVAERDTLAAEMEQERIDEWVAAGILPKEGDTIANGDENTPEDPNQETDEAFTETTLEEAVADEELLAAAKAYVQTILPKTIEDILVIGEEFDSPEGVENMFTWDVSDIFFNYFFLGRYINIGGESGDDKDIIDIYNEQSMASLRAFNRCSEFFAIDPSLTGTEHILDDFIAGKTLFAVVSSDDLQKLEQASTDGKSLHEYGVTPLPDLAESLQSRGLSVTETVIMNGFSPKAEKAEDFAQFIVNRYADKLYGSIGKIACKKDVFNNNNPANVALRAYEKSAALPKITLASDFWMKLEIVMSKAWKGEDANDLLRNLSQEVKGQVTGVEVSEEVIENPKTIDEIMAEQIAFEDVSAETLEEID